MSLIGVLMAERDATESYFARALLAEDIERLQRITAMAVAAPSFEAFRKEALYVGWTKDDMRTHELIPRLDPFLTAIWAERRESGSPATTEACWRAFNALRLERLVGCLARAPVPDRD